MNSFVLFCILALFSCIIFILSKKWYLSPTFLSSITFCLFALEYFVFMDFIGRDISLFSVVIIVLSQVLVGVGEIFAEKSVIRKQMKIESYIDFTKLKISWPKTVIIFVLSLAVAFLRFYEMYRFYGNGSFLLLVADSRKSFTQGDFHYSLLLVIGYYISYAASFIYILLFTTNYKINKKINLCLLLPVLGFFFCAITTTSRSEFIKLACGFLTALFVCYSYEKKRYINIIYIMVVFVLFLNFFFLYGFTIRGIKYVDFGDIGKNIISYSCASLYGLDEYFIRPWQKNEIFGMYTLSNIYSLFGVSIPIDGFEPSFFMKCGKSNIYTSIGRPIHDYGIIGLLLTRPIIAWLAVKIKNRLLNKKIIDLSYCLWFCFLCFNVYTFLMFPIGDKAYLFYLNPKYVIELIFGNFFIYWFIRKDLKRMVLIHY